MKTIFKRQIMQAYEAAVDHSAKKDATIDAQKPELMKQADAIVDALLKPLFT